MHILYVYAQRLLARTTNVECVCPFVAQHCGCVPPIVSAHFFGDIAVVSPLTVYIHSFGETGGASPKVKTLHKNLRLPKKVYPRLEVNTLTNIFSQIPL